MGISTTRRGDADLVERYINTAYDNVKTVADNIKDVNTVVDNLSSVLTTSSNIEDVKNLSDNMGNINYLVVKHPELQQIAEEFENFKGMYYGPSSLAPLLRPNGDPVKEGDMYLNTISKTLFVRVDTYWNSIASMQVSTQYVVINSTNRVGADTVVVSNTPFSLGRDSLLVFINNIYQSTITKSINGTYVETDSTTITFPNLLLADGDEVTLITGSFIDTTNPVLKVTKSIYVTQAVNEQVITLPNSQTYVVGNNNLEVYVNGILKYTGVHYVESSTSTVTFIEPLVDIGTEVIFKKGNLVANDALVAVSQKSDVVTLNFASEFYLTRYTLDRNKVVYIKNYSLVNDNRSGTYVYDFTKSKLLANGVDIIDPDTPLTNQGNLTGLGVWVLQLGLAIEYLDEYLGNVYFSL